MISFVYNKVSHIYVYIMMRESEVAFAATSVTLADTKLFGMTRINVSLFYSIPEDTLADISDWHDIASVMDPSRLEQTAFSPDIQLRGHSYFS